MANSKSAIKRWHQSLRRRDRNRSRRSTARTAVRNVHEAVASGDDGLIREALSTAFSSLDTAAKRGAIHEGKANRMKSRLAHVVARSKEA